MKHFRDLVLSTKEPALHNVLWIKPDKLDFTKYWVYMYEDGWKKLFGDAGPSAAGIEYKVIDSSLPDSSDGTKNIIVQLQDPNKDPNTNTNLYPVTKATFVWMNNGKTVQQAIDEINLQLSNINKQFKKAIVANIGTIDSDHPNKAGKTYWVYRQSQDGVYIGERKLRKYVTNSQFNYTESLELGDILADITVGLDHSLMQTTNVNLTSQEATLHSLANIKDVQHALQSVRERYVRDVCIDTENNSVVETIGSGTSAKNVAILGKSIRQVYMVNGVSDIDINYVGQKKGKIFFYIETINNDNIGHLITYNSNSASAQPIAIKANEGELFFNLDNYTETYIYRGTYRLKQGVYNEGTYPNCVVELMMNREEVLTIIGQLLQDSNFAHLDYANYSGNIYQGLKQGEEQMLVLKSMGSELDGLTFYDYNDDGVVDSKDMQILYLLQFNDPYPFEFEGKTYQASGVTLLIDGNATNKIIDVNNDNQLTSGDITALYTILLNKIGNSDQGEFVGPHTLFCLFDPITKKIKIGYNYGSYIDKDYPEDRENLILLTIDPSPNVLYCNSFNNKLYRWNADIEEMVIIDLTTPLSSVLTNIQNHIQALETYVESQGGVVYQDEPNEPLNP